MNGTGLTDDYYILYSAGSSNGAGSSRSASREAEGTGPTTPRQPAAIQVTGNDCVVPIPAERNSVRRMSSERRKEFA
jgi:hypothetical protein